MCLRFQFCTHQRVCILYFLKKSKIRCTLLPSQRNPQKSQFWKKIRERVTAALCRWLGKI
jgi:hypothetical protein